jgi:hypothetical protein
MRQSILLKIFIVVVVILAGGGAVLLGFLARAEVWGETAGHESIALSETYTHPELGFSFRYPVGFTVTEIPEDEGSEVVLVEDAALPHHSFQVFYMPYDEAGPITPERIRQDLPDKVMADVHTVRLAGVEGLAFTSDDDGHNEGLGRLFEVWTVHDGRLYQLATYPDAAEMFAQVLRTWTFHP